ncbi:D-inositol-3-phosphate glycosyltransferase [Yersinia massiliensis]|uniref:glycosyltransferase n=1 Tax=Yersinia massiliensis TaxID=419257 RepID=UPI0005E5985F|nr:glycosyltransferase [Yersinia massiliensis]CNI67001.1 D-inositol-3-phosphate glycosyltransferase [Yersinia massiliensis]
MGSIIVNATAMGEGGALTILTQLVRNIGPEDGDFIIFIPYGLDLDKYQKNNIKLIKLDVKSWFKRIAWDNYGLNKWILERNLTPSFIISMQNTSIYTSNKIPQLIYLHQPIPFSSHKWSFYKKEELKLFLYKHFYNYFIFRNSNKSTTFVVQTDWMKKALINKGVASTSVYIIKPSINDIIIKSDETYQITNNKKIIFYPATPFVYKNHVEIIKAIGHLKSVGVNTSNISCVFTFGKDKGKHLVDLIEKLNVSENFDFVGELPINTVMSIYKASHAVVFPSYIETFGLPLLEAAAFGKHILAADEPYAREVLDEYSGVDFLKINNPSLWANKILEAIKSETTHQPLVIKSEHSWSDFFKIVNEEITSKK